jgi:hypothetical protein
MKLNYLFGLFVLAVSPLLSQTVQGELKKWHKVTIDFQGPATSETNASNPFMDYRLDVTFTNGTKTYVVPGYYAADGNAAQTSANSGNVWRVHFTPDATGTWTYKASFRTGTNVAVADNALSGTATSFDGQTGTFAIANTDKTGRDLRGKGRLQYVGEHYLRFAQTGEYFIKAGADAMENTLAYDDIDDTSNRKGLRKSWSFHQRDYDAIDAAAYTWKSGKGTELLGSVKYLSDQGMNAFSFLTFNLGGDDENVFPQLFKISVAQYEALAAVNNNQQTRVDYWNQAVYHDRFDVSKMAQWENIFEYADKKGMYLHFKTMETETDDLMDNATMGNERKIYYRELIARFGHHLALNWNICEEISLTVPVVKNVASYIKAIDPYDHHIVLHTYPTTNDYNNYYGALTGNNSELTGASMQIATLDAIHGSIKTWVDNSATSGKKWVVANDEQGNPETGVALDAAYPTNQLPVASTRPDNRDEVRNKVLWGTLLAGGDGAEYYYGYQTGCTDLNGQDHRTRETKWKDAKIALEFFNKYLQPHLTTMVNNDNITSATNDYVMTKPGSLYVSYLPTGGGTMINLAGVTGSFAIKWYDPRNGGALQNGNVTTVAGGSNVGTGNPPNSTGSDWVVVLTQGIVLSNNEVGDYANGIDIAPNPVSNLLYIKGLTSDDKSITVYDIAGKRIVNNRVAADGNQTLDVAHLSQGIYILKTESGKVMRFVKQ